MAGRPTESETDLVPTEEPAGASYDRDFYTWSLEQARHVREGSWDALDRDNVAEEIESLGREQFNKLSSALRVLMLHMLKWDHQPELRSRSWAPSSVRSVLFRDLYRGRLVYNKTRQANITREMTEIASGAEALG